MVLPCANLLRPVGNCLNFDLCDFFDFFLMVDAALSGLAARRRCGRCPDVGRCPTLMITPFQGLSFVAQSAVRRTAVRLYSATLRIPRRGTISIEKVIALYRGEAEIGVAVTLPQPFKHLNQIVAFPFSPRNILLVPLCS
jgi:hypothetical protein